MRRSGAFWDVLGPLGTLWDVLGRSGTPWGSDLGRSGSFWGSLGRSGSPLDVLGRSGAWVLYLGLPEPYLGLAEPYPGVAEPYPSSPAPKINKKHGAKKRKFYVYFYVKKFNFSSPAPRSIFAGFLNVEGSDFKGSNRIRPIQIGFGPSRWGSAKP